MAPFDLLADAPQLLLHVGLHVSLAFGHFLLELLLQNCLGREVIEVQLSILLQQLLILVLKLTHLILQRLEVAVYLDLLGAYLSLDPLQGLLVVFMVYLFLLGFNGRHFSLLPLLTQSPLIGLVLFFVQFVQWLLVIRGRAEWFSRLDVTVGGERGVEVRVLDVELVVDLAFESVHVLPEFLLLYAGGVSVEADALGGQAGEGEFTGGEFV